MIDTLAASILALINSKPSSPTQEEISRVIAAEATRPTVDPPRAVPYTLSGVGGAEELRRLFTTDKHGDMALYDWDGPPMAYYEILTQRLVYKTVQRRSSSPDALLDWIKEWASKLQTACDAIVWRRRPEVIRTIDGEYVFHCRLHLLPDVPIAEAVWDGEMAPEVHATAEAS